MPVTVTATASFELEISSLAWFNLLNFFDDSLVFMGSMAVYRLGNILSGLLSMKKRCITMVWPWTNVPGLLRAGSRLRTERCFFFPSTNKPRLY